MDAFDPLPDDVIQASLAAQAEKTQTRKPRRAKLKGAFVQVPLPWAYWAMGALSTGAQATALLSLLYRLWEDRKPPAPFAEDVKLTAADMRACGLGVGVRDSMLRRLEQAGLARIARRPLRPNRHAVHWPRT